MTIAEANAVNVIARDALNLAANGVPLPVEVKAAIETLLRNAYRVIKSGHDDASFRDRMISIEQRHARRERRKARTGRETS